MEASGGASVEIKADGRMIDDTHLVVSIDTWNAVNKVPRARIVLDDGSPAEGTFAATSDATFPPGAAIEISAGYGGSVTSIFSGIVIRHGIEISQAGTTLVVELADAGKVTVAPPASTAPVLRVRYGESILELRAEMDAVGGDSSATQELSKICGQVQFQGSALAQAGAMIELAGVSDRFNGNVFISAVHHSIRADNWVTAVDFGLPAGWHAQQRPSAFAPAAGHVPPIGALQSGTVTFDDTDRIVTLRTPGGHTLVLDDKAGSIRVTDCNENSLILGKNGIVVESASNIEIKAGGDITITPQGNLSLTAKANATCEGRHIDLKAHASFSAQGSASAELKSSGMVTVEGALVKIN